MEQHKRYSNSRHSLSYHVHVDTLIARYMSRHEEKDTHARQGVDRRDLRRRCTSGSVRYHHRNIPDGDYTGLPDCLDCLDYYPTCIL